MNLVERVNKDLQDREKELLKLSGEQKSLKDKIDALQKDRGQAVRGALPRVTKPKQRP